MCWHSDLNGSPQSSGQYFCPPELSTLMVCCLFGDLTGWLVILWLQSSEYRSEPNAWRKSRTKLYLRSAVFCSLTHHAVPFLWVFILSLFDCFTLAQLDYLKNFRFIFYVPAHREPPLCISKPTCIWAISCMQWQKRTEKKKRGQGCDPKTR